MLQQERPPFSSSCSAGHSIALERRHDEPTSNATKAVEEAKSNFPGKAVKENNDP